jgi:hypothetical protein
MTAGAPATATADCECWHYVRAEGATANATFNEVAAPAFDTALAAGIRGTTPLLARWNGVRWQETPLPVPQNTVMEGVAASSTRDAWAVGHTPDGTPHTVRWTGGQGWQAVAMPAADPSFPRAVDARSAEDAWIVGSTGGPHTRATAWHWDGRGWRSMPVPVPPDDPSPRSSELVSVSARTADDVWAVGGSGISPPRSRSRADQGSGRSPRALVAHWDGRTWTPVPASGQAGGNPVESVLSDVTALAEDDVWAVGTAWPGSDVPLVQHWNGRDWETVPIPLVRGRLYSVAGDGRGGVWVAGGSSTGAALLAHWNGERWDVSGAPTPGDPDPGEGSASMQGSGAVWGLAHARGTSYLWAVGAYERPGAQEPVQHVLTWTNAPRHR